MARWPFDRVAVPIELQVPVFVVLLVYFYQKEVNVIGAFTYRLFTLCRYSILVTVNLWMWENRPLLCLVGLLPEKPPSNSSWRHSLELDIDRALKRGRSSIPVRCTSSYGICVLSSMGLNVTVEREEGDLRCTCNPIFWGLVVKDATRPQRC